MQPRMLANNDTGWRNSKRNWTNCSSPSKLPRVVLPEAAVPLSFFVGTKASKLASLCDAPRRKNHDAEGYDFLNPKKIPITLRVM